MSHTLKETIELAVKNTILRMHPIGKLWLTLGDEDPSTIVGGGWEKISTYVLQCSSDKHKAGETIEAGLPNITGQLNSRPHREGGDFGGAITAGAGVFSLGLRKGSTKHAGVSETSITSVEDLVTFDASRCSSVYGNSTTVQPNTIIINVWKRVS